MLALISNTAGFGNVADGVGALYNNTTGSYNIALGYQALYNNTTGQYNTATGYQALFSNTGPAGKGQDRNYVANGYHSAHRSASKTRHWGFKRSNTTIRQLIGWGREGPKPHARAITISTLEIKVFLVRATPSASAIRRRQNATFVAGISGEHQLSATQS